MRRHVRFVNRNRFTNIIRLYTCIYKRKLSKFCCGLPHVDLARIWRDMVEIPLSVHVCLFVCSQLTTVAVTVIVTLRHRRYRMDT